MPREPDQQISEKRSLNWKRVVLTLALAIAAAVLSQFQSDPLPWWEAFVVGAVVAALPIRIYRGGDLDWLRDTRSANSKE